MCLAIPGRIVEFEDEERHLATVEVSGVKRTVNVDLLREEGVAPDDWVLIHVGFAMSKVSEQEAQEQLNLLKMMGEADAALEEMQNDGTAPDSNDRFGEYPFRGDSSGEQTFAHDPPDGKPMDGTPSEDNPAEEP